MASANVLEKIVANIPMGRLGKAQDIARGSGFEIVGCKQMGEAVLAEL